MNTTKLKEKILYAQNQQKYINEKINEMEYDLELLRDELNLFVHLENETKEQLKGRK